MSPNFSRQSNRAADFRHTSCANSSQHCLFAPDAWFGCHGFKTSSSVAGALRRGWINLKSAVTGGNEHAILAECERREDSAVEEYKKALDDGLSPSAQELVSRQFAEIKAAHDRIRSMRDATKS